MSLDSKFLFHVWDIYCTCRRNSIYFTGAHQLAAEYFGCTKDQTWQLLCYVSGLSNLLKHVVIMTRPVMYLFWIFLHPWYPFIKIKRDLNSKPIIIKGINQTLSWTHPLFTAYNKSQYLNYLNSVDVGKTSEHPTNTSTRAMIIQLVSIKLMVN